MLDVKPISPNKAPADTTVVVAMSGGVDSSTVAGCLSVLGYRVIGVTLQLYNGDTKVKKGSCCAGQDIYDAKRVASKFNIPHYVLNYESLFKQKVIDDFVESYVRGQTPIPCVRCNQTVKFTDLLKVAYNLGADALATGHYVRRIVKGDQVEMHSAHDENKDQSYFLFATTIEQLKFLRFPLGEIAKEKTREVAMSLGVEIADKPDSQDICFVQNGSYSQLVGKLRPDALKKGKIIHLNGQILGEHEGVIGYTVGQRRGLKIPAAEPLYVIKINPEKNEIIVGPKKALGRDTVYIREVNWIADYNLKDSSEIKVKLRSGVEKVEANIIQHKENEMTVQLAQCQLGISSGQACVFYQGSQMLGGGWISGSK